MIRLQQFKLSPVIRQLFPLKGCAVYTEWLIQKARWPAETFTALSTPYGPTQHLLWEGHTAGVCSCTLQSPGAVRKFQRYVTLRSCFSQHNSKMTFCAFPFSSSLEIAACPSISCVWWQAFASPQHSLATRQQKRALSVKLSKTKSGGICIFSVFSGYLAEQWLAVQHVNSLRLGTQLV